MRYSHLAQINPDNVNQLKVAWTYRTGELQHYEDTSAAQRAAFEATPIMVDGTLYLSTPSNRVIALDATNGEEHWVYDPKVDLSKGYSEITSRGVSTWLDADLAPAEPGRRRIFVATIDGRLIALDAANGRPIEGFGDGGTVDLRPGVGRVSVTSPAAVIGDLLVVGSSMGDNARFDYPPGVVRAYDVRTGELRWSWDPIPRKPEESGWETWKGPKAAQTGAANAWSILSVDPERNLIFVPTSCPSPDYYGGERKGKYYCPK
jgi:quinoprotein glucose dehydrogenase